MKNNFPKIVDDILNSKTITEEINSAKALQFFFNELISNNILSEFFLKENNGTVIKGGIALSSKEAKDCIEDPIRTVRFLKGIFAALIEAKERFKNEKIRILYAGCGPLGTLIIPLLHLFSSEDIEVILLDIHQTSIDSVKKIVEKLGYKSYIKRYVVTDATLYKHSIKSSLHVIISETMDRALAKEPQVEITKNLAKQLVNKGIFIPEKIKVERGYSFFAKEYVFNSEIDIEKLKSNGITKKQKLFSITSKIDTNSPFFYETEFIFIPTEFKNTPDLCLYTNVVVYKDIQLYNAESYITNPICLKSLYNLTSKEYKLQYSTNEIPKWEIIEK